MTIFPKCRLFPQPASLSRCPKIRSRRSDGWPLDTQHFGEQVLSDLQSVIVSAVTHHEQPTRQPLLETVRPVARYRHQDLLGKGLGVSVHQLWNDGIDLMARVKAARGIFAAPPGI
jgi:hypothetical protein